MKVHLLYKDEDLRIKDNIYTSSVIEEKTALFEDLEINNIISTMSNNDSLIEEASRFILSTPLNDIDKINYRQNTIKDALDNKDAIKELYNICKETSEEVRYSRYSLDTTFLSSLFSASVGLITIYLKRLKETRNICTKYIKKFSSTSFTTLFNLIIDDFSDSFINDAQKFLLHMNEGEGTLISAKFGSFLQGTSYTYRKNKNEKFNPLNRFAPSYTLPEMDYISAEDLSFRRDKAINETANVLAKVAENFEQFFEELKYEIAFLMGCINLYDTLSSLNLPTCFPHLLEMNETKKDIKEIYDVSLSLYKKENIVTNDLESNNKYLFIITGANQGGKTTFLKAIGQAFLLSKCGMKVGAKEFNYPIKNNIYTHFKKEEDNHMNRGKLDEEMSRMDKIVSNIKKWDVILSNESFSSTNEREGSEIFRDITKALIEYGIEFYCVTHMYEYAVSFKDKEYVHYLIAEHNEEKGVTFKIKDGEAKQTAFGTDIYNNIFNA